MAPHAETGREDEVDIIAPPSRPARSVNPPRVLIVGAGSRGNAYARETGEAANGIVVAVAEPITYKRQELGQRYIWGKGQPSEGQEFENWKQYLAYETERRAKAARGESVPEGVDAVFICVLDEMHKEVILGLAPLGLHIMCEKPLTTNIDDCVAIYKSLLPDFPKTTTPQRVFSVGHVLRYSQHNIVLRKLLLEDKAIGEILSVEHTEPVGWWHFAHSFVRGNWRKQSTTAPSLLTKSCHDIDLLLWLLCSPAAGSSDPPHIPSTVQSSGSVLYFKKNRKPTAAEDATNCLSCPIEESCQYSAKKIYVGPQNKGLATGNTDWPIKIVLPEIEECIAQGGQAAGEAALLSKLSEDYTKDTPAAEVDSRSWYGRCVYEADNDVNDNQMVTMTWEDDPLASRGADQERALASRGAKMAIFHMVASSKRICERYTHIYGSAGEIWADSETVTVEDFRTGRKKVHRPFYEERGHGGGDGGLTRQFILAVDRVKNHGATVEEAQNQYVGCTLEEVIRGHAMVFAAEDARLGKKIVDFPAWWKAKVLDSLAAA